MLPSARTPAKKAVLVALAALVVAATFRLAREFGVSWDESVQAEYGERVLRYFTSGLVDRSSEELYDLRFYGPAFELIAAAAYRLAPEWKYEIRHGLVAVTALLALVATGRFAMLLPGATRLTVALSVWASLTMPQLFGHAFFNSKDIPFAAAFSWTMVAVATLSVDGGRRFRPWLAAGAAGGLCLAVRPGGSLILAVVLAAFVGVVLLARSAAADARLPPRRVVIGIAARAASASAIAWTVMIAAWPWAHHDPIGNPLRAIRGASSFWAAVPVLFRGVVYRNDTLPRSYLPEWLLISTPPVTLLLVAAGVVVVVARSLSLSLSRRPLPPSSLPALLALCWVSVPVLAVVVARPPTYDGMRHFLFLLPGLALFAGVGGATGWQALSRHASPRLAAAIVAAVMLSTLPALVWLHPYQYAYVNMLGGGMSGAHERYDADYWATSYKEAAAWVNRHGEPGADGRLVVLVAANAYSQECFAHYLRPDVEWSTIDGVVPGDLPAGADYYVATTRLGLHESYPEAALAYEIARAGSVFAVVKRRSNAGQ